MNLIDRFKWDKTRTKEELAEADKKGTGRVCGRCGRSISEHKRKVMGSWVCNLALLTDGRWVHTSRLPDIVGTHDPRTGSKIRVVTRLDEP